MKLTTFLLVFTLYSCASSTKSDRQRERLLENRAERRVETSEINSYPEIYLANESALQEVDTTEGIVEDAYFTGNDFSKFTLGYNFSFDFENLTKISVVDFAYSQRISDSYRMYWWSVHYQSLSAIYNAIADDKSVSSVPARSTSNQSMSIFGLGIGHRFRALAGTMSPRFFEMINVYGNYVSHIDSSTETQYQGYGYNAEYALNYRSGERITYGLKFTYNWALVDRAKENDDESLQERSLVFGWSTLGFELGYYF